ncbi:MAG: ribose-5-phosphate isomerase RpiA [Bryobacterales bacterium]|nr:ribose-5-phosphate isomerase RpiA [Bryobacterales bacterium]
MSPEEKKRSAARAALDYIESGWVIGVGSGSTSRLFIEALASVKSKLAGAVASSEDTARRLSALGIPVLELNEAGALPLYVDGADESTAQLHLIKGGGGALTREKVIAGASARFVCIADDSKLVEKLGAFPLPVEVIPMAESHVSRCLESLGGNARRRAGFKTDNGNIILDVHRFTIPDPVETEKAIDHIAGAVTNGIFALRPADVLLLAGDGGVRTLTRVL